MEFYRVGFDRFYSETFDDYRDVENAMSFLSSRGIPFTVQRSPDRDAWQAIARPYEYRAPSREYATEPGEYDCQFCGLVGGH